MQPTGNIRCPHVCYHVNKWYAEGAVPPKQGEHTKEKATQLLLDGFVTPMGFKPVTF